MRVIATSALREFWEVHPDGEAALRAWLQRAKAAKWQEPAEVNALYLPASILRDNRVVFDICGNKYRLVVRMNYGFGLIYVRFIGTHAEYDGIDARTI